MKISSFFTLLLLCLLSSTGCEKQNLGGIADIQVYIPNIINLSGQQNNIFYPSVFSDNPNVEVMVEVMELYDRYGNSIYLVEQFPANDVQFGWYGTFNGNLVESGNYSYSISISDGTGANLYVGDFSVIR